MTVYIISQITIHDRAQYDAYEAGFMDIFEQYEGTMLSVDENAVSYTHLTLPTILHV